MDRLRFLVEVYSDYQKDRIRFENRLRNLPEEIAEETFFKELAEDVRRFEESLKKEMARELETEPIYIEYLKYQKGIGTVLAAYLVAWLCRPREFRILGIKKKIGERRYVRKWKRSTKEFVLPTYAEVVEEKLDYNPPFITVRMPPVLQVAENPSDLHKYCGVSPGCRRIRGEATNYNPKLKTLMWKLFRQLLMAKGEWAKIARQVKEEYAKRCPDPEKGSKKLKVHLTTKNIVMRRFLTNLWIVWRRMNGLPITEPYPAKLGHTITPPFIEKDGKIIYL